MSITFEPIEEPVPDEDLLRRSTSHACFDDFLPLEQAQAMRAGIEAHFAEPFRHQAATHQIWNYWYVPGSYTYLRTLAERVIGKPALADFNAALQRFAAQRLGLTRIGGSLISMYVNGCFQTFHNDSHNGRFAFVYSLTKPVRSFTGGETLVWREGDYFEEAFTRPLAHAGLYDVLTPDFNRLVLFDDRMPHAVAPVLGQMDPLESRIVMHGHISEGPPDVQGTLAPDIAGACVARGIAALKAELGDAVRRYHGPLSLDIVVDPQGRIDSVGVLVNRLMPIGKQDRPAADVVSEVLDKLDLITFPTSSGETELRFPILFGT
jgi:hypothetical protein